MPFAFEPAASPALEIPAPIVTTPASGARKSDAGPSFQDHLERANRTSDSGGERSSTVVSPQAPTEADDRDEASNADSGERAEAARRDEAADRAKSSDAAAESKPKQESAGSDDAAKTGTDGRGKVEAGKKHGPKDHDHKKKQADEANVVAVVAAVVVAEPAKTDEVALTEAGPEVDAAAAAIAEAARAGAAKETDKPTKPTDGKGRHLDPTNVVAKQEAGAKEKAKAAADAISANADTKLDAAKTAADADAGKKAEATGDAVDATTISTAGTPILSELHSTKADKNGAKAGGAKSDAKVEAAGEGDAVAAAVVAATSDTSAKTTEAKAAVTEEVAPTTSNDKSASETKSEAAPSFTAQLQSAVEAVAAASATAAATTTTGTTDAAAQVDTTAATTAAKTATVDTSANTAATKTTNEQPSAAELLRANASTDASTARAAGEGERSGGLSAADRARLVQRVARAFRTAQERGGELQIRLSPPELGQLRLQVQMVDGTLSARIEAETPHAQQVITDSLAVLRDRLAEQNVRVDRIDVELMNSGSGGSPNMPDRRQDPSHENSPTRGFGLNRRGGEAGDAAPIEPRTTGGTTSGDGRLNVVI